MLVDLLHKLRYTPEVEGRAYKDINGSRQNREQQVLLKYLFSDTSAFRLSIISLQPVKLTFSFLVITQERSLILGF